MAQSPDVVIIAGPNGAGKSTTAPLLLRDTLGVMEFVNADTIAQGLSAFDPDRAAMAAGRIMLGRLDDLTIGPLLLWAAAKLIPGDVMDAAREAVRRKQQSRP